MTTKTTIRNKTDGERGLYTTDGTLVWLKPGEMRDDLDILPVELTLARQSGYFAFDDEALAAQTVDDLAAAQAELAAKDARIAELEGLLAERGGKSDEPATAADITTAIGLLDGKNDDHWTNAGLPAVEAVAELAGKPVTRAAITEAAPDAKRPTD